MNYICYSLWGKSDLYNYGAIENALRAKDFFPNFKVKIFHDDTCNISCLEKMSKMDNVVLVNISSLKKIPKNKMMWRFIPAIEEEGICLCRDLDSFLSERDKKLVNEFLKSKFDFHIIRDNEKHTEKIMGCGWGSRNGILKNLKNEFYNYDKIPQKLENRPAGFGMDQEFLAEIVYPYIVNNSFVHVISPDLIKENEKNISIVEKDRRNGIGCSFQNLDRTFKFLKIKPFELTKQRENSI